MQLVSFVVRHRLLLIVLLAGAITQFVGLGHPPQAVFDEVHFGKFVNAYCCTRMRFFDIHPPHAKLFLAASAALAGYDGTVSFDHIGQSYGDAPVAALRVVPALAGALLPVVIFVLFRQLGAYEATAFLGGMVVVFDNALTLQNRIISLDGILLLSTFGALSLYLVAEQRFLRGAPWGWVWFLGAGALAGLAVGAKFTGLAALALLGVLVGVRLWSDRASISRLIGWVYAGALVVVGALIVYAAGWAVHFMVLTQPGSGDAWHVSQWTSPLPVSFVREVVAWHRVMLSANYNLVATHPDGSSWWSWPLMRTSVFYWYGAARDVVPTDPRVASLYFLGNPAVWWGGSLVFVMAVLFFIYRSLVVSLRHLFIDRSWIALLGYCIAFAPLVRVPRVLFLYHYLTPLLFSLLFGLLWAQRWWLRQGSLRQQPRSYFVVLSIVVVLFLFFSPFTYGFYIDPAWHERLFWFDSWR